MKRFISSKDFIFLTAVLLLGLITVACGGSNGTTPIQPQELTPIVFIADKDTAGVFELFISSQAGASITKLSGTLIAGGDVVDFRISPDGNRIAFVANKDFLSKFELFIVSIISGTPVKISGDPVSGMVGTGIKKVVTGGIFGLRWFEWAPDGSHIAYIADQDTAGVYELFSVRPNGAGNARLSDDLDPGGSVKSFAWAPDSSLAAYLADQDTALTDELFTSLPDRSFNPNPVVSALADTSRDVFDFKWSPNSDLIAYRANQTNLTRTDLYVATPLGTAYNPISSLGLNGRTVESDYAWSPDGNLIAYRANKNSPSNIDLYTNPINPIIAASTRISGPFTAGVPQIVEKIAWSPNSLRIAYTANQNNPSIIELYSAPRSQAFGGIKVSDAFTAVGAVSDFAWSPDSLLLAYTANKDDISVVELYTTLPDQVDEIKISGAIVAGGSGVFDFVWSPDNSLVGYRADEDLAGVAELFTAIPGGGIVNKVSGTLVAGGNVTDFKWEPAARGLAYRADQDSDGIFELFVSLSDGSQNTKVSGTPFVGTEVLPNDPPFGGYEWAP
jgi:Tol biopolymer transport system component